MIHHHSKIFSALLSFVLLFGLSGLAKAELSITLEKDIPRAEFNRFLKEITFKLYSSMDIAEPVATQTFKSGEWEADLISKVITTKHIEPGKQRRLKNFARFRANFTNIKDLTPDMDLWVELELDGVIRGEREPVKREVLTLYNDGIKYSRRWLNIAYFGAVADSDTSKEAVDRNDAALQSALQAARQITKGNDPIQIYFPAGNGADFYALSGFSLQPSDRVILTGDPGLVTSRIHIVSTVKTSESGGTAGIYFAGNHHSWSGIKDLRLQAGCSVDHLVEIDNAHNGMMFEGISFKGNENANIGLRVNRLSRFRITNFVSSGFNEYNFYFGVGSASHLEVSSGNLDIGGNGFAYIKNIGGGAIGINFTNIRMEGAEGKRLVHVDTGGSYGTMRFYSCMVTNHATSDEVQALIYAFNSTGKTATVWVFADVIFQYKVKYWIEDVRGEPHHRLWQGNIESPKRLNLK